MTTKRGAHVFTRNLITNMTGFKPRCSALSMNVLPRQQYPFGMVPPYASRNLTRHRPPVIWVVSDLTLIALVVVSIATVTVGARQKGPFTWLVPTSAPVTWHHEFTPAGTATLSYPPSFLPVESDPLSVSVAVGRGPEFVAYLNVTPRQGDERLADFAAFRLHHLGDDGAQRVHDDGGGRGLPFHGGRGSGVLDDYFTRVGNNHYREIAALVVGGHGSWVIVGASLDADYARFRPLLQQAISSFAVS